MAMHMGDPITIVGAGIAGAAIGALLADRGHRVEVFEARADPRAQGTLGARSINLALSERGLRTIERLGLGAKLAPYLMPMLGRVVHDGTHARFDRYDLVGQRPIYSVRRQDLMRVLLDRLEAAPNVRIEFGARCEELSIRDRSLSIRRTDGRHEQRSTAVVLGADGVHSPVRAALAQELGVKNQTTDHAHAYKEAHISAERARAAGLRLDALHVWPAGPSMLIALPNADQSFTVTLFFPAELLDSEGTGQVELQRFVRRQFPEPAELISNLEESLQSSPTGSILTVDCARWHDPRGALLLGDAAHAMAPFFGQGMNCALEDCAILDDLVGRAEGALEHALRAFASIRRSDVAAISAMSLANYLEMRSAVREPRHALRRELERELQLRHPDRYLPQYAMVSFSSMPYASVQSRAATQAALVDTLLEGVTRIGQVDLARASRLVCARLMPVSHSELGLRSLQAPDLSTASPQELA